MGLGFVVAWIWMFRIWRTYRQLNGVSPGGSAIAFVIFAVAQSGGHRAAVQRAASLSGASPPSFAARLVGRWELTRDSRSNDVAVHNAMMFNFDPKGYYINLITKGTTNGRCYVLITDGSYGTRQCQAQISRCTLTITRKPPTTSATTLNRTSPKTRSTRCINMRFGRAPRDSSFVSPGSWVKRV
jgi:hypothetical protein